MLRPDHVLKTHQLFISDLYTKAYVHAESMTPAHISSFIYSYDIFKKELKRIPFKSGIVQVSRVALKSFEWNRIQIR